MVDFCINNNMFILNGRYGDDKSIGALTCKSSSTVDYVICSVHLFSMLSKFKILDFCNLFSDAHNPLTVSITVHQSVPRDNIQVKTQDQSSVKLWCSNKAKVFCSSIEKHNSNLKNKEEELQYIIENGVDKKIF